MRATKENPVVLNTQTNTNRFNKDSEKTWKKPLRVEFCKYKVGSSPLQTEMCKPKYYRCFLWYKTHMVVIYVDFENLC